MKMRFGAALLVLMVSCSSAPGGGNDPGADAGNFDVAVDIYDAHATEDGAGARDVHGDSFEVLGDAADARDVHADEIGDSADVQPDVPSDVLVCGDVPKEGCPCDEVNDEPCCLEYAKGLSCEGEMINGVLTVVWGVFWDCGCTVPEECRGQEVYGMCPWK